MDPSPEDLDQVPDEVDIDGVYLMPINNPTGRTLPPEQMRAFVDAVLDRWPGAVVILDSVYVRLHPDHRRLLSWYLEDPRYADVVLFIDSLSKTHGVTGLRSGAILTRSSTPLDGIVRYAQNVMAGPSNAMQAATASLLASFLSGDDELVEHRIRLQMRIGRHLQRRRRLLLSDAFERYQELFDSEQPLLPDPKGFDWEGSMYAVPRLSEHCRKLGGEFDVSFAHRFLLSRDRDRWRTPRGFLPESQPRAPRVGGQRRLTAPRRVSGGHPQVRAPLLRHDSTPALKLASRPMLDAEYWMLDPPTRPKKRRGAETRRRRGSNSCV
jgi:aspartate/methionine/tyrosine aminotransferase